MYLNSGKRRLLEKEVDEPIACWERDGKLLVVFAMEPNKTLFKKLRGRPLQTEKFLVKPENANFVKE